MSLYKVWREQTAFLQKNTLLFQTVGKLGIDYLPTKGWLSTMLLTHGAHIEGAGFQSARFTASCRGRYGSGQF